MGTKLKGKSPFSPSFRGLLIDRYCNGKKIFYGLDVGTRYELMKEAVNTFKRDMIIKFGSRKNYEEWFARLNGFKNYMELRRANLHLLGFSGFTEYNDYLAKKQGFDGQYHKNKERLKKLGFKSFYEYYSFLANKKGLKTYDYTHPNRKVRVKVKKICGYCKNTFISTNPVQIYCSAKCRCSHSSKIWRKRHPEEMKRINREYYLRRRRCIKNNDSEGEDNGKRI